MNGKALTCMARLGFVFNFDTDKGVIYVNHNTNRNLTDFDVERVSDVFPNHIVALTDNPKRIVAL